MRRIRTKKSRKYEQDKLQAAINASARQALDDLDKSSGMLPTIIGVMAEQCRKIALALETSMDYLAELTDEKKPYPRIVKK